MVNVILVRHGETDWNHIRRIQGAGSDTPLNEKGKEQAENIALRLKDEKIEAVYSSPLQRAVHTAEAIARYHHLKVSTLPELKEIAVGEQLEGKPASELRIRFDELLCGAKHDPLPRMLGGESLTDVQQRAWTTIKGLVSRHPEGKFVVVTHYFVIMSIVCAVINLPLSEIVRLRSTPGSVTMVSFEGERARLELFNDVCHSIR